MAKVSSIGEDAAEGAVATLVATEGCMAAPWVAALLDARTALPDLADAVHALCALHGATPGLAEIAAGHEQDAAGTAWLIRAAAWFADERAILVRLTAAVGPLPSTPGQAESEAAIAAQRHALAMLASSHRAGVAIGAALALSLDWLSIRRVLTLAALRAGVSAGAGQPMPPLPAPADPSPGRARAMAFGAQQLLAQHRGLWQLLDARASARHAL